MFASDLALVGADEPSAADDLLAADVEPVDAMGRREDEARDAILGAAELERLNRAYEERHGFRFVVFVKGRPKAEILEVLRRRIDRPSDEELETAVGELVAIAEDRWRRS